MAENSLNVKIKQRYDTESNWASANPILLEGEIAISSDKGLHKAGDGTSTWSSLSYNNANAANSSTTATKLATARTIRTNLASTSTASFDGSADITPGVTGTLPVANGGTGQTTANAAANAFINSLSEGTATPSDADYYVAQYAGGGTTTTTYHRRPISALWDYIKGKISSVLGLTSSSYGGNSATATALTTSAGSATQPVYFSDGKPVATTYTLGKSVPSDAVFTDTVYTHPTTAGNKHIPSGGESGQILGWESSGTAKWCNEVKDLVVSGAFSQNRRIGTTVGNYSHAEGLRTEASGEASHAEGTYSMTTSSSINKYTTASGKAAHAEGTGTTASGDYSHAQGYETTASGDYSHAQGYKTTASGNHSSAGGYYTTASGTNSHAEGYYTESLGYQHVQGHYNDTSLATAGSSTGTTGTAFVIGNGTTSTVSNACRITYAGAVIGKAAYASTGADMAEFREWLDGNPNNEDRRGYFVTMDGMNIKIAEPGDYICGIISANPSLIGNNDESWMGRYVFDEFGAFVYEDYEETDPETGETHTYTHYKLNPDYDPTRTYEFRADRPEWDYVGLCGVINTRDDGTCEVNGFCKCGEGGVATASERGYRVLERVNDHVVKVLFYLTGEIF